MTRLGQSQLLRRAGFVALLSCAWCASARAAEPTPPPAPPPEEALELQLFQLDATVQNLPLQVAKTDTRVAEAPIVVEVITRQQMREWGYRTVAEVLQHMVGFYVEDDHTVPNVAIRGISGGLFAESGLLKVMIDGHAIAFRSTSGNWLGPELVPLSAVDRIEIVRGPASALYGADAFLGVINIITRRGDDLDGGEIGAGFNTQTDRSDALGYDFDSAIGGRRGGFDYVVSARFAREDRSGLRLPSSSPAPTVPSYNSADKPAAGLDQYGIVGLAQLSYQWAKSTLSVTGYVSAIDRGGEFGPWTQLSHGLDRQGRFNETRIALAQGMGVVSFRSDLTNKLSLKIDANLFGGGPTGRDRIEVASDTYYARRQFGYFGVDANAEVRVKLPRSIALTAGVNYILDREQLPSKLYVLKSAAAGLNAGDVVESVSVHQGNKLFQNAGAYLLADWTAIKRYLKIAAGVRYDYHDVYGSEPSGRLAAVSEVFPDLYVKLLYGSAFKAPSPFLLYAVPLKVGDVIGNPRLAAQYVHTVEAELSYRPPGAFSVRTDIAYNLLLNGAQFTQQETNQIARNIARVNSLSWETEVSAHWRDWVKGYATFELNYAVREIGDVGYLQQLVGNGNIVYPAEMVHAGAMARIPIPKFQLRLTGELSWIGARRASDQNTLAAGAAYELPSYVTLDATLSTLGLHLLEGRETTIRVIGHNLTGTAGPDPGFSGFDYPVAPRMVVIQLTQQL